MPNWNMSTSTNTPTIHHKSWKMLSILIWRCVYSTTNLMQKKLKSMISQYGTADEIQVSFSWKMERTWQFQKCLIFTMNCCSKCTILREDSTTKPLSPWWFGSQLVHMSSKLHRSAQLQLPCWNFYLATFIMHLACTMCCAFPTFGKNEIVERPTKMTKPSVSHKGLIGCKRPTYLYPVNKLPQNESSNLHQSL
jgi:hypothetical protein